MARLRRKVFVQGAAREDAYLGKQKA